MYEFFSEFLRIVMQCANKHAQKFRAELIAPEHILLAMLEEKNCRGYSVLREIDVDISELGRLLQQEMVVGSQIVYSAGLNMSATAKRVITFAKAEAMRKRHIHIGTEDLLIGLRQEQEGLAAILLQRVGVTLENAREAIEELLLHTDNTEEVIYSRDLRYISMKRSILTILALYDSLVDQLDLEVFDAAYIEGNDDPDEQVSRAMDPSFCSPVKVRRDEVMEERNALARILHLQERYPHSFDERDYTLTRWEALEVVRTT